MSYLEMSIRDANALKATRRCLKCNKVMWTDRCHRICPKCTHTNEHLLEDRVTMSQDLRQLLRQFSRSELGWREPALAALGGHGEE